MFDLSSMGGLTSRYATVSIGLRIPGPSKPHHYIKVGIPLVGNIFFKYLLIYHLFNNIIGRMLSSCILHQYLLEYDLCTRDCVMIRTCISPVVLYATLGG